MHPFASYRWLDVPKLLGLALVYALCVRLVLSYLTTDGNISPVWLPSGLGLAALMIGGRKYWPAIFAGAMSAYLFMGRDFPVSFFIASSNVIEPLLAVWLLSRVKRFDSTLQHSLDYLWLILIGSLVAALAAAIGVATLASAGILPPDAIVSGWLYWWRGNLFGIAMLAPTLLVWRTWPRSWLEQGQTVGTGAVHPARFCDQPGGFSWLDTALVVQCSPGLPDVLVRHLGGTSFRPPRRHVDIVVVGDTGDIGRAGWGRFFCHGYRYRTGEFLALHDEHDLRRYRAGYYDPAAPA